VAGRGSRGWSNVPSTTGTIGHDRSQPGGGWPADGRSKWYGFDDEDAAMEAVHGLIAGSRIGGSCSGRLWFDVQRSVGRLAWLVEDCEH
jgi:hypothetical protein